ncbi:unnamed protein product [Protopolystoma xenopodis]|uniref:Uncharacterized protein n=1 Tax=Protopolystoma xenopodis TaxID=117903 RepID=A0A3S5BLD2_9PLAT|nr:unnamed protein product [Protopolystoma xenopodis]
MNLVDPSMLTKSVGCLNHLYLTALHQEPPAFSLLRSLLSAMVPIYRLALLRAVKLGVVEAGVIGGQGIEADSQADIALETFRRVATLKDDMIRLLLPTLPSQPGSTAASVGVRLKQILNDGVRISAVKLIEVSATANFVNPVTLIFVSCFISSSFRQILINVSLWSYILKYSTV